MFSVKQIQIASHWPTLLSLLVATLVWCWPVKPVWYVEATDQLLGLAHDNRSVLT